MNVKTPVMVHVESIQSDGELREETRHSRPGTLYERDGAHYLLYDDDGTATTVRIQPDEVRLYRRGEVSSWQVFQLGEMTGGLLTLGNGDMILRVMTSHFLITRGPGTGRLDLHYELFTGASSDPEADPTQLSLGKFSLTVVWEEL